VTFRSGIVAVVGRPNTGKSSLINAMVGTKVAIVSNKPQTTRFPVRGVLTGADRQVVFTDTPGYHRPRTPLGERLNRRAEEAVADVDVVMLAGRYTLLEQDSLDDLLPVCVERRAGIVAAGIFNSGILAQAHPSPDAKYDYRDAPREVVDRARAIAAVCERYGTTLPAAAIAFPLAHPAVVSVCVGARSAAQVERNIDLYHAGIPADLWSELKALRLVREDAPVPT